MARKVQLKNGKGEKIYPVTSSSNVGMSDGSGSLDSRINRMTTEYNVSVFHPDGGIDGTNKYTLETAIAKIPEPLRNVGIKCSFIDEGGKLQTWEWQGGAWATASFSQVGSAAIESQKDEVNAARDEAIASISGKEQEAGR